MTLASKVVKSNLKIILLLFMSKLASHSVGQFHIHVFMQLLRLQIAKVQRDSQVVSVFLCFWDQGSISSTFYVQLLRLQIPNAQKRQSSWQCRLVLLEPMSVKAVRRTLIKLTPASERKSCLYVECW